VPAFAKSTRIHSPPLQPWLTYVDGLVELGYDMDEILKKFEVMAQAEMVKPSVFIKSAFYHMVNPVKTDAIKLDCLESFQVFSRLVAGHECLLVLVTRLH